MKTILLTSAWPGEGKTTVGLNLAASFGELGHRVLICDADLKNCGIARQVLSPAQLDGTVQELVGIPGVKVMLIAPGDTQDLSAYLGSSAHRARLAEQFGSFDIVLVDGPPVSVSSDAFALLRLVDGVLMVASRAQFQGVPEGNFSEDLREYGASILGIIAVP